MVRRAQTFHLSTPFLECDLATAMLAEMANVWSAMACVRENDTEKGREEKGSGVDAARIRKARHTTGRTYCVMEEADFLTFVSVWR